MRNNFNIITYRDISDGLRIWNEVRFWISDSSNVGIITRYRDTNEIKINVNGIFEVDEIKKMIDEVTMMI